MSFTRVVYAENTYDLEEKMNKAIFDETKNGVTLRDIKFNSVFQGGNFGTEKISNTAILIFEQPVI
ncbi:hypothetical protein [Oceanobacillus massiliensis]|uniref:hypothetical protein n=1 Tax=Oceanobacillus massiliensis TaxID=1465765 RepID=UPI00028884C9|nr:hypothetical protein [Oceanobacillus massiliensis]